MVIIDSWQNQPKGQHCVRAAITGIALEVTSKKKLKKKKLRKNNDKRRKSKQQEKKEFMKEEVNRIRIGSIYGT